jgi:hypothetical protein
MSLDLAVIALQMALFQIYSTITTTVSQSGKKMGIEQQKC